MAGAILAGDLTNLTVTNSIFIGNTAFDGGAIMFSNTFDSTPGNLLHLSNTTFQFNSYTYHLCFSNVRAVYHGGAVYQEAGNDLNLVTMENCTFESNAVLVSSNGEDVRGGAVGNLNKETCLNYLRS